MRNATHDQPDRPVRPVQAPVGRHGTATSPLVEASEAKPIRRHNAPLQPGQALMAFSEGRMTKEAAVAALGLRDYADLLLALGQRGLPMPALPRDEVEAMADTMQRLLAPGAPG